MRYFEVRLVLEALDDADAHKLAGRVGSGPNGAYLIPLAEVERVLAERAA